MVIFHSYVSLPEGITWLSYPVMVWDGNLCPGHLGFYFRDNGRKKTDSPEKTKKLRKIQENPILI